MVYKNSKDSTLKKNEFINNCDVTHVQSTYKKNDKFFKAWFFHLLNLLST